MDNRSAPAARNREEMGVKASMQHFVTILLWRQRCRVAMMPELARVKSWLRRCTFYVRESLSEISSC